MIWDSWGEFLSWADSYGFVTLSQRKFPLFIVGTLRYPTSLIAAHPKQKLLLHAISYFRGEDEVVSHGTIYGTVDRGNLSLQETLKVLEGQISHNPAVNQRIGVEFYLGQNPRYYLEEVGKAMAFVDWHDPNRHLYLLDTAEADFVNLHRIEPNRGHADPVEVRKQEFLQQAPDWVKAFIL